MSSPRSIYQDAIRILFLLVSGSQPYNNEKDLDIQSIYKGKTRLYAMDFWMRYPDYFAHELLSLYKETRDIKYLNCAQQIFKDKEPDLRTISMIRYLFGAYDDLDNTLSVLISKGLIKRSHKEKSTRKDFLIYSKAHQLAISCVEKHPILKWYKQRSELIVEISGTRGGHILKYRQYQHIEYAQTKLGGMIPSIRNTVLEEINNIIEETIIPK